MSLTKISNQSLSSISSLPATIPTGALTLISTQTASNSASISFTSGLDSTYNSYIFKFINIHPATDQTFLTFQGDTGTNTNYNQTVTTTYFTAYHNEGDSGTALTYNSSYDLSQSTNFITIADRTGTDNDQCISGTLQVFSPASTTFVKHFLSTTNCYEQSDYTSEVFVGGYFNTTTAITRLQFKMSSGNIESGVIKLYGVG